MLSNTAQYGLYLAFLIPAILCSLFVLYYLLFDRALRQALSNHVIIVLALIAFIQQMTIYPGIVYFYSRNGIWERPLIFCEIWGLLDWGLYIVQTMVFAWATVERHILIFHDKWVSTKKKRFFVHYFPLIFLLVYCFSLYSMIYFYPPCENSLLDGYPLCVVACFQSNYVFYMWEAIVHQIIPSLIIVLFSIALFSRILWQKHRMNQPINWRKHRKMAVQLLSISLLYLIFSFPPALATTTTFINPAVNLTIDTWEYLSLLTYFTYLLFPFVCAMSLPNLRTKLANLLFLKRRTRKIHP
ncbi:unnamed protein product [Adineta ricciae]|uniref:G-protein coupled receptors family 1 profile domain-containing protein n=1 Tax=Adineta ricciae TaxID=249248 RepID=A0A815RER3_ADIRI|nr:unnamed protein product [Adineta ricciae]